MNTMYTSKEIQNQMKEYFKENGFLQLLDFLEFLPNLNSLTFNKEYSPLFHNFSQSELPSEFEYFKSEEFKEFIQFITNKELTLKDISLKKYEHKDFTLLNDLNEHEEETHIIFDLTKQWEKEYGGILHYITHDEEVFNLEPNYNALTIIHSKKEYMKYLKYINNKAKNNKIVRVEMTFK